MKMNLCDSDCYCRCHTHSSHTSDCFCQFYNSMCRNLPRRYVLPLTVDEQTPVDQNLVSLHNYKATAMKLISGEVRLNTASCAHCLCKVICLTVHASKGQSEADNQDEYSQPSPP